MQRIGPEQRRARLGLRHHLAHQAPSHDVVQVAGDLCGLHATDPATVFLAATARLHARDFEAVEAALYEDRSLVRLLGMRRTMFVAPRDLAAVVQASSSLALLPTQRRLNLALLAEAGVEEPERWLAHAGDAVAAALERLGEATAVELGKEVPELRQQVTGAAGTRWAATQGMAGRVLLQLGVEGRVVRGRPRGSWVSTQYRWAPMARWLGEPLAALGPEAARAELVRRWLRSFGPGTEADLRWWTGWALGPLRRALREVGPVEVDLGGGGPVGLVLPDDVEDVAVPAPWVALLPGLDPTPMGWAGRDWYLGPHRPRLFDRSGNIGPTAWCDGRVVGGWAQRAGGEVVVELLEDVGDEAAAAVHAEAARLGDRLAGLRVTPRFRTPLERELAG